MNDTPTPVSNKAKIAFTSLFANDDAYWVPFKVSCKLERELTTVTEQRDAVTLRLGRTQEKMFDAEKQRDRLAEALREIEWSNDSEWQADRARTALQFLD